MYEDIKQIARHSLIYGLGIYIGKAVGLFMIPVYTRALSPADYGVMELLNLTSYIIGVIFSVGVATAVYRFYFDYEGEEAKEVISSALIFTAILSCAGIFVLSAFTRTISNLIFRDQVYSHYLRLIFLSTAFDIIAIVPGAYIRVLRKSVFFTAVAVLGLTLALALNIYLIVFMKMGVLGVLWSGIISSLAVTLCYLGYTLKNIKLKISFHKLKRILKYGYPLMPEAIFVFLIHFSNRYFLQRLLSLEDVGVFSLAYKFSIMLPFLISQPFGLIWSTYKFEIAVKENAKEIYSRIITYYFLVNVVFWLVMSVFIKEIIYFVTSPGFYGAYKVVPLVTLGFVFWGLSSACDMGILLKNKTYFKTIAAAIAAIVSLCLNYLLIPRLGIFGAAVASFGSFVCLAVISLGISIKLYPISFELSRIAKISLAAITVYLLSGFIRTDNMLVSVSLKLMTLPIFAALLFLSKFFKDEEMKKVRSWKVRLFSFQNSG